MHPTITHRASLWMTVLAIFIFGALGVPRSQAQLVLLGQFNPAEVGGIVGAGFDGITDSVWVYGDASASIHRYTRTGTFLSSVSRPGESANDADLGFAPEALTLAATVVPAGTLLMVNGETDAAEIYAIAPATGTVLATLNTAFGLSHVVGGAYHAGRDTFFLVQDRVPAGTANDSVVAEINPIDGSVLNSFKIDNILAGFTVNFGDIEVNPNTGNLFVVSSDETSIAEFTPTGGLVQTLTLPDGVSGLSGIAIDAARHEAWVTSSGGTVYRLGNIPEPSTGLLMVAGSMSLLLGKRRRLLPQTANETR